MSFLETQVLGLAGTAVGKLLQIKPTRRFEAFSDFCSITETHNIAINATQYPIEDGTQGTDHIVRQPKNITWDVVFGERSDPQGTYQRLLDLMYSGVPFTAVTGLRRYDNMLLVSVTANQDTHSSRILKCTLTMQEILITFPPLRICRRGLSRRIRMSQLKPLKPERSSYKKNRLVNRD